MGAEPARISAEDFLTPPELSTFSLAANGAGRIGGVRAELVAVDGVTRLGRCYQQVPLRVLPPFHFGPDQPALLYLLNPTAGLMDGDGQLVELHAGPGARAVIVGQSATRIHPAVHGFCTQRWRVTVEEGAIVVVLPGPAIPFAGCRYYQQVNIDLAPGAAIVWGDLWLSGRYARGELSEQFRFETMVQDLTVCRAGRLIFRDRFCWRGPWDESAAAWHFADHPACGSLFATGAVEGSLAPDGAMLPTAAGDCCIRWHGTSETVCSAVVQAALGIGACHAGAEQAWLLENGNLAPNHWFSTMV